MEPHREAVLGHLFIIFMNDLHLLPLFRNIILFADDTTVFNSHRSNKFLKYTLEHDLKLMIEWFKANKLSLNLNKTELNSGITKNIFTTC